MSQAPDAFPASRAEPSERFRGTVQTPEQGSFDFTALQWTDKVITKGKNKGKFDQEAYIKTERVQDFIHGVCAAAAADLP